MSFSHGEGRRKIHKGEAVAHVESGRLPRVTRMLALAIRFDHLLRSGTVTDQADLARLGHVTRARVTQIMSLLQLAPDVQEAILFLPRLMNGRDPIKEHQLRPIAALLDWRKQRHEWEKLKTMAYK